VTDEAIERRLRELARRVELAEEVIRLVEDDALPPAALPAWERYRAQYPRENG
jgi:hypothetical protein